VIPSAQSAEFQTWSDITTIHSFGDNWRYDGVQGFRGLLSPNDFTTIYFNPSVRYRVKPWFTVHGGIRFFQTFNKDVENNFELGPWQGLRFTWPQLGGYAVSHYFRLEERWQTTGDKQFDFTLRGRYQLGIRSPTYDILLKNGMFLMGSIEAFCDIERPIFVNRLRYNIGVGTRVSDTWQVQLHCLLQQGRNQPGAAFSGDQHILRLRLFYTF
jgi:hypothetical protein